MSLSLAQYPVVVVVAHATGCGHCVEYLPIVREVAPEWADRVPTVLVDIAHHPQLVDALGVEATPTTVLLKHGRIQDTLVGLQRAPAVKALYAQASE